MKVRNVSLSNFLCIKTLSYSLPERGVVLVTGQNGRGKTTMTIEAACYALSGNTFRGTPAKDEGTSTVVLETWDGLIITRKEGKTKSLDWSFNGTSPDADTTAKSKEALSVLTGATDNWKRTHVFSAADLLAFSGATDASRKLLLEDLVGLGRFDEGYKAARADLQRVEFDLRTKTNELSKLQYDLAAAERESEQVQPPPPHPVAEMAAEVERLQAAASKASQLIAEAKREYDIAVGRYRMALSVKDICPTCNSKLESPEKVKKCRDDAAQEQEEARLQFEAVKAENQPLMDDYTRASNALKRAEAENAANAKLRAAYEMVQERVSSLYASIWEAEVEVSSLESQKACLDHSIRVIQAVRGKIFTEALGSLTDLSNRYLDHLLPGMRISLEVTKVRATAEAISLQCDRGDGKLRPYEAMSGGQRRRVDIALLLSLSQLAPSAGTLYFDEAFDTLDQQGIEAVCELLADFGQERCVVVISHNEELVNRLPVVNVLGPG